jgi:hypothetical protein
MLNREVGILGVIGWANDRDGVGVGIDGPLEWRGGRKPDGLGVVVGNIVLVFDGAGVIGSSFFLTPPEPEASETGGDGGDVWRVEVSDFGGGGVHIEGDEVVVTDVEASDKGEGGRTLSVVIGLGLWSR